jgi:ADP-ribose pyrophosphatase
MDYTEKTLKRQDIYQGRIVKLHVDTVRLPDGREASREVVKHASAVAVIAVDDAGNILLVRQFRKPVEQLMLEIPAGIMEENEEPLNSAQRELAEETGVTAGEWEEIAAFYTAPGFTDEKIYLFMASKLVVGKTNLDEDEFIEIIKTPLQEAYDMIFTGQIVDAKSIIGIQYAFSRLNQ